MNPGEKLYERTTDELGTFFMDVVAVIDARRHRAKTVLANDRLRQLEVQYMDCVVLRYK